MALYVDGKKVVNSLVVDGSGGIVSPTNLWSGTLSQYKMIENKLIDTTYIIKYNETTFENHPTFLGSIQVYPTDDNVVDYDVYAINCYPQNAIVTTDVSWLNSGNFEIEFIFGASSYSGTQVLFGNSGSTNFNMIMAGTELRIYGLGSDQVKIDTIVANTLYKAVRSGNTIKVYRESTELVSRSVSDASGYWQIFGWSNFRTSGLIKKLAFKHIT